MTQERILELASYGAFELCERSRKRLEESRKTGKRIKLSEQIYKNALNELLEIEKQLERIKLN